MSLAVRVIEATRIPRGLVLWPDDPVVRLTAEVEGCDHSVHEETMVVSRSSTRMDTSSVAGKSHVASDGGSVTQHGLCPAEVTCLEDEIRCGQQEHTFSLRVATRTPAVGGDDRGALVSPVSLRIEVLVGGLVTCSGKVSLPHTQALTTGANDGRHVVQLGDGAAMTIAVNLAIVEALPHDAADDASPSVLKISQKFASHSPRVRSDSAGSSNPADDIRVQRFLRSIASHGADKHATSSVECTIGEDPVVPRSTDDDRTGGHGGTKEQIESDEGSVYTDLVEWLGRSHPDPPFLRMALEKTGNYSFPFVEAPFVAALLKHSGLVGEAFHAAKMMAVEKEGK